MAKFNSTPTIKTTNKSGHAAYSMGAKEKLVTQVLTSFFNENKFYGDNSNEIQEVIKKVIKSDAEFVAKLAVFARKEFNMRSVSHVLIAYLAHEVEGKPFVKDVVKAAAIRADDITEIMSCYLSLFGKPIPNSLKKGINAVFQRLDEYALAKYKGKGKAVKMRDLLCLCRPTPKDNKQSDMWKRLLNNELETPYTWETELFANGNNTDTWEKLIDSGKVGYMALLRNLRNILKTNPTNIDKVLSYIENPEAVRKAKQLPFRYLSAYKELENIGGSKVFEALENAVNASIENMPKLEGTTVIAVDVSGSMDEKISGKSSIKCYEIATLLGLMANKICENSIFYMFNTSLSKVCVPKNPPLLYTVTNQKCGGGTNMGLPFEAMIKENIKADRVIIFSDNECNRSSYGYLTRRTVQTLADEYRKKSGINLWVHAVDLLGYGTQQFHGGRTNIIAGWSEKVLDFIKLAEQGEGTLEKTITNYTY